MAVNRSETQTDVFVRFQVLSVYHFSFPSLPSCLVDEIVHDMLPRACYFKYTSILLMYLFSYSFRIIIVII